MVTPEVPPEPREAVPGRRFDRANARVVADAETMRALAHPLRLRLLGQLRLHGPATASELGRRFGESSGSTSYHLRQLQRYGFVEPTPEQRSRREKAWRSVHQSTNFALPAEGDEESRSLLGTVIETQLGALADGVRRRQREAPGWPRAWNEAQVSSDLNLRITAASLRALKDELYAVIERFETPDDPDARLITLHLHSYPEEGETP